MFITKEQRYEYESLKSYRKRMDGIIFRLLGPNSSLSSAQKEIVASEWINAQLGSFEEYVYELSGNILEVSEKENNEYRRLLTIYCNRGGVGPEFDSSDRISGAITVTTRCEDNMVLKLIKDAEDGKLLSKSPLPDLEW